MGTAVCSMRTHGSMQCPVRAPTPHTPAAATALPLIPRGHACSLPHVLPTFPQTPNPAEGRLVRDHQGLQAVQDKERSFLKAAFVRLQVRCRGGGGAAGALKCMALHRPPSAAPAAAGCIVCRSIAAAAGMRAGERQQQDVLWGQHLLLA